MTTATILLFASTFSDPLPPGAIARLGDVTWRHGSGKGVAVVSPCSTRLATLRADGREVVVRELPGGRVLRRQAVRPESEFDRHTLHFSDDGTLFLLGTGRWIVLPTGGPARFLDPGWDREIDGISADGRTVLARRHDSGGPTTKLVAFAALDARIGRETARTAIFDLRAFFWENIGAAIAPDGRSATVSGGAGRLMHLRLARGATPRRSAGPLGLRHIPHGRLAHLDDRLLCDEGTRVLDALTGRVLLDVPADENRACLRWWPVARAMVSLDADGRTAVHPLGATPNKATRPFVVAAMDEHGSIFGTDVATGKTFGVRGEPVAVRDLAAFGASMRIFRADGTAEHWDARAGTVTKIEVPRGATGVSPSGKLVAVTVGDDLEIRGPKPGDARRLKDLAHFLAVFSPDDRFVALHGLRSVGVYDVRTGARRFARDCEGYDIAFSRDGRLVAAGTTDRFAVYEVASGDAVYNRGWAGRGEYSETGLPYCTLAPRFARTVEGAAHSRDGLYTATAREEEIFLRKRDGTLFTLRHAEGEVKHLAFSPDGRTLYSAGRDGVVLAWELPEIERGRR